MLVRSLCSEVQVQLTDRDRGRERDKVFFPANMPHVKPHTSTLLSWKFRPGPFYQRLASAMGLRIFLEVRISRAPYGYYKGPC